MFEPARRIARIAKAHGRRGEVVVEPTAGLPPLLHEGMSVCIVPPLDRGSRWHVVASASGDASQLVSLEDVDTRDQADELVGRHVLVLERDLPDGFELMDVPSLLGREVHDEAQGPLGEIVEVMATPAHDVWCIAGPFGEVLLPVVDEVVLEVSDAGPIIVSAPLGSIDLGEGDS